MFKTIMKWLFGDGKADRPAQVTRRYPPTRIVPSALRGTTRRREAHRQVMRSSEDQERRQDDFTGMASSGGMYQSMDDCSVSERASSHSVSHDFGSSFSSSDGGGGSSSFSCD